jgi:hypothetical protein
MVEVKMFLFSDNIILYIENLKDMKIIRSSKFNKVVGYKINIQKSVVFLYINSEVPKNEIKKVIPFIKAIKHYT